MRSKSRDIQADEQVRETLEELRERGFVVVHGADENGEGATDHLVSGPTGLFLINARHRRYEDEHLRDAWRRAEELFRELHTWVTPVICLASARFRGKPSRQKRVWVVRREQIVEWIARQRNPVLELERVADLAGRLTESRLAAPSSSETTSVSAALLDRAHAEQAEAIDEQLEPNFDGEPSI